MIPTSASPATNSSSCASTWVSRPNVSSTPVREDALKRSGAKPQPCVFL
jgi:hypothetical protein